MINRGILKFWEISLVSSLLFIMNRKIIEKVFKELSSLSEEEFKKELEKHKDGDISRILQETGAVEIMILNKKKKKAKYHEIKSTKYALINNIFPSFIHRLLLKIQKFIFGEKR